MFSLKPSDASDEEVCRRLPFFSSMSVTGEKVFQFKKLANDKRVNISVLETEQGLLLKFFRYLSCHQVFIELVHLLILKGVDTNAKISLSNQLFAYPLNYLCETVRLGLIATNCTST